MSDGSKEGNGRPLDEWNGQAAIPEGEAPAPASRFSNFKAQAEWDRPSDPANHERPAPADRFAAFGADAGWQQPAEPADDGQASASAAEMNAPRNGWSEDADPSEADLSATMALFNAANTAPGEQAQAADAAPQPSQGEASAPSQRFSGAKAQWIKHAEPENAEAPAPSPRFTAPKSEAGRGERSDDARDAGSAPAARFAAFKADDEWDEQNDDQDEAGPTLTGRMAAANAVFQKKAKMLPWSKLSWVALAVVCGVATSLLTRPMGLVAAFRAQPEKFVGGQDGGAAQPGKQIKVEEASPGRLKFAQVNDVIAQQQEGLGVETIDPAPSRQQRRVKETPPAGSVVTVPMSQGRLLRFDEAVESVFIADPSIADVRVVSADVVYVYGKRLGLTNLMAVSGAGGTRNGAAVDDKLTASVLLRVVTDPRPAQEGLQDLSPMSDNIDLRLFGRRAVVSGRASNVDQAVDAAAVAETYSPTGQPPLNRTTVEGSTQVNIRVRFAEVSRNDLQSFGIDWSANVTAGAFNFGVEKVTGGATAPGTSLASRSGLEPNLSSRIGNGKFNLEVLVEALKRNGMLHVLAEPNLTAVTGETASFLAGGEVPVPVPQGGNSDAVTVQYKSFGVSLLFTPTIIRANRIGLKVKPEVSSIATTNNFATAGFALPSFTVRRAETTVEVASGQTFAIGGLFQRQMSRDIEKFPILGDVPVLGQLFTSERYQRNETELVILITPYMVEPVRDDRLVTPLDREGPSPWQASVVDPTTKGAGLAKSDNKAGFIFK
jgi:pilus assembly protein CpaC